LTHGILIQSLVSDMLGGVNGDLELRARRHAALGDPLRLAMVDALLTSDLSPHELQRRFGVPSNLLAHHLDVLQAVGIVTRTRSSGDGRRRYLRLRREALAQLPPATSLAPQPALFICTHNSARSQLAAALWTSVTDRPAESAGTHPADRVHPGAVAAARRAKLDLRTATPRHITDVGPMPDLVVTVCDRAHEELAPRSHWLHWSIPDPVVSGRRAAFADTIDELTDRITTVVAA
jgi:ArsR family transcriptional regulator, arsenate/arsenite/antimonite-responsive transcriptional repressor / arsenate reductase (thioredoxin)